MNDLKDLKPCPFCGDVYIMVRMTTNGKYSVGCNTLNCIALHCTGKTYRSYDEAVKAWNRRTEGAEE